MIDGRYSIFGTLTLLALIGSGSGTALGQGAPRSNVEELEEKRLPDTGEVGKPLEARAEAKPTRGKAPLQVQFDAQVDGGAPPMTIGWIFGDGSAASAKGDPLHTYGKAGVYRAQLAVKDSTGDTSTQWVEITVE